jgi:glutaconate CoA-transferase subunit B
MICTCANLIEDDRVYWVGGGGYPLQSIFLAHRSSTPNATIITEDGGIGPQPALPLDPAMAMVSARTGYRALGWSSMNRVCTHASLGLIDYGILQTLQVDPYGNINSSFLGTDYFHPDRRYGGAGGANEIASLCWRTILMTMQEKRKFVKKVDFISSPGFLDGSPNARERAGLPTGTGPYRVLTPEAMFGYDEDTRYLKLLAVARWVTVDQVLEKMDFEPMQAREVGTLALPTEEQLLVLRTEIDPRGQTIGTGKWIEL